MTYEALVGDRPVRVVMGYRGLGSHTNTVRSMDLVLVALANEGLPVYERLRQPRVRRAFLTRVMAWIKPRKETWAQARERWANEVRDLFVRSGA